MSSTILHALGFTPGRATPAELDDGPEPAASGGNAAPQHEKHPFLAALGARVRELRARRGMTRRALSAAASVSQRHLANLEQGVGNASVLLLLEVAGALKATVSDLLGDEVARSPEWLLIRELLENRDEATLRRTREAIGELLGTGGAHGKGASARSARVALIGLRGAGKSTLGRMLAEDFDCPFVELSRKIEEFAGCSVDEIQSLYGQNAYRRYERRALEEAIQIYPEAVIAIPGGLVSEAATFNLLLAHCTTVWLQAAPEDHLRRVAAQGDLRPMAGNQEALGDLKSILAGRAAFYSKAELRLDTSSAPLEPTFRSLRAMVGEALGLG